jgi:hypothetical protein
MGRTEWGKKNMVAPLSWEAFESNQVPQDVQPVEQQATSTPSWDQFQTTNTYQGEPDPTSNESSWGYLTRLAVSNLARGTEHFLGKHGDIEAAGRKLLPKGSMGLLGDSLLEMMGRDSFLPTSEELKQNITFPLTGEYTKPKTKKEAIAQEISGDVGSIGRGRGTIRQQLINKLGIPVASTTAKETVEHLGLGEEKGSWAKMAAMTALSLLNNVNATAYAANLMNQGRQGFGQNIAANVPRYENAINRAARPLLQGDPRTALAQQQIAGIRNDIATGQTSMGDLMRRYDALNAAKRDRGLFTLRRGDRQFAIRAINDVRDSVREEIRNLGQANPQALQQWENGVNAFSVIHRTNAISNLADRVLTGPYSKAAVTGLFGAGAWKSPMLTGGASAVAGSAYKMGQVAIRVWNDPNLARYYWEAMSAAARDDAALFLNNFKKLNDGYEKKYGHEGE